MMIPRRVVPACVVTAFLLSCDPPPTTVCVGGPPQCNGEIRPTSVSVTPGALTLTALGETVQLDGTVLDQLGRPMDDTIQIVWSSSQTGITTVTPGGLVEAVANGVAVITASAAGAIGTASAVVAQAPTAVVVTPDPLVLPGPGSAAVLSPSFTDPGGSDIPIDQFDDVSWSSDDTGIATVIDEGVVTAEGQGATKLRVVATNGGVTVNDSVDVTVSAPTPGSVVGQVRDAATSLVVSGAAVAMTGPGGPFNALTDGSGNYSFTGVPGGTYTITVTGAGFDVATAVNLDVAVGIGEVVRADFALTPTGSTLRFGGLSGKVTFGGAPLADAPVSISGGAQTNGIFQSTTTDANGNYSLVGINMDDTDAMPIATFTVLSTRGFSAASVDVALVQNQTLPNVDLNLQPSSGLSIYFEDDFETAASGWTTTGFWNRSTLAGLTNTAYPTYVELAPSDLSNGDLPMPVQGQYVFWYGQPSTGNFLGMQVTGDAAGSGGTGQSANQGTLTSPSFSIPAGVSTATLRLSTWFEIESVNPNDSGFDVMTVGVLPGGGTVTDLARLNPFVDPTLPNRDAIPFTSGGFNKVPVWRTEFLDLSAYAGQTIQLVFEFDTVDPLYNGFRGWIIDEVSVSDLDVGQAPAPPAPVQVGPPPTRSR
jgi:hypothetical protein